MNSIELKKTFYRVKKFNSYNSKKITSDLIKINIKTTGQVREYRADGTLFYQTNYYNGLKNGIYIGYSPNGNIYEIKYFINDKLEGKYITYYDNFNIKDKGFYKNDLRFGEYKTYFYNGNIREILYYNENGKMSNEYTRYNFKNMIEYKIIFNLDGSAKKKIALVNVDVNVYEYIVYNNKNEIIKRFPYSDRIIQLVI